MAKPAGRVSAGIVLYRRRDGVLEVLLGHPGGPYFARKDYSDWLEAADAYWERLKETHGGDRSRMDPLMDQWERDHPKPTVTAADTASFIYFPFLIGLAVWYRKRMDVHMRLLFMASLGITGPANARIANWFGEIPNPVLTILFFSIAGAVVVHDIRTRGRPHWATIVGVLMTLGLTLGFRFAGVGDALVASRLGGG